MAVRAERAAPRPSLRNAGWVLAALLALAVAIRIGRPEQFGWAQNFLIVFGALLVEALPFVLLGATVSAAIEVFVPVSAFEKVGRLPRPLQLPAAALAGFAFPVCECGSVPVARRMAAKGLRPAAAVTFMLAAPILNPIVIASTVFAYRGRSSFWTMVLGRVGLGFLVAIAVGWVVGTLSKDDLLRPPPEEAHEHEHEREQEQEGNGHHHGGREPELVPFGRPEPRWHSFFHHLGGDFLFMGKFLVLGATVAAAVQTFLPTSFLNGLAATPVLNLLSMMVLAALLSLCSESDAFVAASFVQFGPAAQLAFLVAGPMVDMKLGALYMGTFSKGFTRTVVIAVFAVTLVGTLWIQVLFG